MNQKTDHKYLKSCMLSCFSCNRSTLPSDTTGRQLKTTPAVLGVFLYDWNHKSEELAGYVSRAQYTHLRPKPSCSTVMWLQVTPPCTGLTQTQGPPEHPGLIPTCGPDSSLQTVPPHTYPASLCDRQSCFKMNPFEQMLILLFHLLPIPGSS